MQSIWKKYIYFSETTLSRCQVRKGFLCVSLTVTAARKEHKDKDTDFFYCPFPLEKFYFLFPVEKFCTVHIIMLSLFRSQTRKKKGIKSNWLESSFAAMPCPPAEHHSAHTVPSSTSHPAAAQRGCAANRLVLLGIFLAVLGEGLNA